MRSLRRGLRIALVTFIIVWSAGPIVFAVLTSVSQVGDVPSGRILPSEWTMEWYKALLVPPDPNALDTSEQRQAIREGIAEVNNFRRAAFNTVVQTVLGTALIILVAFPAGYAFSRMRFLGNRTLFYFVAASLFLPLFAAVVPLYQLVSMLGFIDTLPGLLVLYMIENVAVAAWVFAFYIRDLPRDAEEAALIDGCTRWRALWRVILPQLRGAVAAITAITALAIWGDFFMPLLFAPTMNTKPATILITEFVGKHAANLPLQAAAGLLVALPPAILALALNKQIRGMLANY